MLTPTRTVALARMSARDPFMLLGIVTVKSSNGWPVPLLVGAKRPWNNVIVPAVLEIVSLMSWSVRELWIRCEHFEESETDKSK